MKDKYSNSQFGFRENYRTSDSLFILKTLINKYLYKNKTKQYLCCVDFQKAFDSVWRDGLLYKLANIGIGKYFYSTVKNMLAKTEIALKIGRFTLFSVKACAEVIYEDIKESGGNRVSCFTPLKISKYSWQLT
jgi:hypothetical protein